MSVNSHCKTINALVEAINALKPEDWKFIYDATRARLLAVHYNLEDSPSNRVLCEMDISNAFYDIRDRARQ